MFQHIATQKKDTWQTAKCHNKILFLITFWSYKRIYWNIHQSTQRIQIIYRRYTDSVCTQANPRYSCTSLAVNPLSCIYLFKVLPSFFLSITGYSKSKNSPPKLFVRNQWKIPSYRHSCLVSFQIRIRHCPLNTYQNQIINVYVLL